MGRSLLNEEEVIVVEPLRKMPIGVQSFEKLIRDHYLYVDKTKYIYELVHNGNQYFLSRPRRFGKSLLLSTMRAYWEGKKELFTGLDIERLEKDNPEVWQVYPVFYFDFNRDNFQREDSLESVLETHLQEWENKYNCGNSEFSLAVRFQHLLVKAFEQTGRRCVVLVDEYDKPLLEVMHDPKQEEHNKAVFKGFFSTLKSFDEYLQFVLITGVTKFSKVSIFSDLNQLKDISIHIKYAGICGITEKELKANFMPEIQAMAGTQEFSTEECLAELRKMYDGYHFYRNSEAVYNPFSLLNALDDHDFRSYWFGTGTPTFLVRRLKELDFEVCQFTDQTLCATEQVLSDYRSDNPDPIPLLYQTGYLTLTGYDKEDRVYILGFPNEEVKYGFLNSLMPEYVNNVGAGSGKDILSLKRSLDKGDLERIRNVFTALFASLPYPSGQRPYEHYFQTILYLVFMLLDQYVHSEIHSFQGRADCVVETKNYVYLFEFKRDESADAALQQIEENGYALPYAADPRTLYQIGVNFDSEQRMLSEWKVKENR